MMMSRFILFWGLRFRLGLSTYYIFITKYSFHCKVISLYTSNSGDGVW